MSGMCVYSVVFRDRTNPTSPACRRCAFTLIEVIVVMAIIALLVGLILPALAGAKKRGLKTRELNDIKQVGQAWMMYGNSNNDAALPGFLDLDVQQPRMPNVSDGWGVVYKLPDNTIIDPGPSNLTGPWTWRLMSYLSYNHPLIHSYLDEPNPDLDSMLREGKTGAYEPAFGYNGQYIGGWWQMVNLNGMRTPFYRFYDHCELGGVKRRLTVPLTISQIERATDMVTFCAASRFDLTGTQSRLPPGRAGWHLVTPPMVEQKAQWSPNAGDAAAAVDILASGACAPLIRYTNTIAVMFADGHVDQQGYNALNDMRKWVSSAQSTKFSHAPCGSP